MKTQVLQKIKKIEKAAGLFFFAVWVCLGSLCGILSWGCRRTRGMLSLDQILYHLGKNAVGSLEKGSWENLLREFCIPVFCILLIWWLFFLHLAHCRKASEGHFKGISRWHQKYARCVFLFFGLLGLGGFFYASWNHQIFSTVWHHCFPSSLIEKRYVSLDPQFHSRMPTRRILGCFPARRRNLVFCVCESLEETFSRKEIFGEDLIRELTALPKKKNWFSRFVPGTGQDTRFGRLVQVEGTQFTVASLCGILYGLPLLPDQTIWGRKGEDVPFFPNHLTWMELLQKNGYRVAFVQGGHLEFGGKYKLFSSLAPEDCVCMERELESRGEAGIAPEECNNWGFYDRWTIARAKEKFLELSREPERPFALMILTVDPHEGNPLDPQAPVAYGDERDIVRWQSRQLAEFVAWLQRQKSAENTMIVLTGDHNMMRDQLGPVKLSDLPDRALFHYVWNGVTAFESSDRLAATFDWAPTILQGMGFLWDSHGFGIGQSLYSGGQTVLESIGVEEWQSESFRHSDFYRRLSGIGEPEEENIRKSP